ncbi:MAG: beta-galactosidase GalA [Gemmatimonadales bacterium]
MGKPASTLPLFRFAQDDTMPLWSRRQLLQSGAAASIAAWLRPPVGFSRASSPRERLLLDFGWRFHLGHANDEAQDFGFGHGGNQDSEFGKSGELFAPSSTRFDDSAWRMVDLPHDWAVELPFVEDTELNDFGDHPIGRKYPATSIGWYRRVFTLPAADTGRRISLEFDGIFRDALIALNGHLVGRNFSGYAPYRADITDLVTWGGSNVLVLRVDATEHEGWFYEGAGIYRHVWLVKTAPVHVAPGGTFVSTAVTGASATVSIATDVANDSDADATCRVVQTVRDGAGRRVATTRSPLSRVPARGQIEVRQHVALANPELWSIETPALYCLDTAIERSGSEVDLHETPFGIRTMHWDANAGFFLNGKRVELKGTCNHQDHAGVGVALPDRLQEFRIAKLKEMGSNAYRTSHNPPTAELLDACDRLGMLVLDENRTFSSQHEGMSQLERLVRRDRNHPCVFAWSLANEESSDQGNDRGQRMATTMRRLVRRLDPTRPVTAAMNGGWGSGFSLVVDVQGFNYGDAARLDAFRARFPGLPAMGSEVASTVSTRGIYQNDRDKGYVSAYDVNFPPWAARAETWWTTYAARAWLAGGFVWTGFDYRGEPTPYQWPCINSHFGIMDTCGFPKDNFYYYQAWWSDKPVLHLFPHWNWAGAEGQDIDVWVQGNIDRVELLVNGSSVGAQDVPRNSHVSWKVPYAPGNIEARGFRNGQHVLVERRETTGAPAAVMLHPDRARIAANGEDVSVITVSIMDAAGRVVPTAGDQVAFRVSGAGKLIGVGNGDPSSHEPDKATTRRAFNGLCCAIVQASKIAGEIQVEATAVGLRSATTVIVGTPARARPALP